MHVVRFRKLSLFVLICLVLLGTSGCFKANVALEVKADGSGIMGASFGLTQQAKALLSSNGEDPFQSLEKNLAQQNSQMVSDTPATRWVDGDYEWMKVEKGFQNLDEINQALNGNSMFDRFSLSRNQGFFQSEFVLDAEISQLNDQVSDPNSMGIDPATFMDIKFSAKLPGKIVDSNGFADVNDPSLLTWTAQGNQSVPVKVRTVAWNWLNIILVLGGVLLLLGLGVGVIVFALYKSSRKKVEPSI
jgi:hypothetical protein